MSIEIRAKVGRFPKVNTPSLWHIPAPWRATVYVHDTEKPITGVVYGLVKWRSSLPEALQAVQVMRRELNQQLMDEVRASRASRRDERCAACAGNGGEHTYLTNCDKPARSFAEFIREFTTAANEAYEADLHTIEATA